MFDDVQAGWLAGDDYRRAAEAAGVVELPDPGDPASQSPETTRTLPNTVLTGRWEDSNPPGVGQ